MANNPIGVSMAKLQPLRHCEIVQDVDKMKVDIQATCMKYRTIKQWAYIEHNQDDTRPHYHIYLNFGSTSCPIEMVAKWFQLEYTDENGVFHDGTQFIERIKRRKADMLMYLTHENESQKYKHIYDRSEVHANFDFATEIEASKIIGDFEHYSYAQQLQYVNTLPIAEKTKSYSQLRKLWELYCQCSVLQADRNIEVVFISGKGGTGKTFYAKKMLTSLGYDFCVSSSSNDPFQDYAGQRAIILDDLRDSTYEHFEDLLKVLDNNTQSSVKSRFNNKVFNGKMIVITSSVPLCYWYPAHKYSTDDSLQQLYRRIGCYVEITAETVTVYNDGVGNNGKPKGKGRIFANELQDPFRQQQAHTNMEDVFSKICDDVNDSEMPF